MSGARAPRSSGVTVPRSVDCGKNHTRRLPTSTPWSARCAAWPGRERVRRRIARLPSRRAPFGRATTRQRGRVVGRAERVGFEPTDELPRHLLSREARSTRLRHLSVTRVDATQRSPTVTQPARPARPLGSPPGAVAERTNAPVLKTGGPQGPEGSNPSRSAHRSRRRFGAVAQRRVGERRPRAMYAVGGLVNPHTEQRRIAMPTDHQSRRRTTATPRRAPLARRRLRVRAPRAHASPDASAVRRDSSVRSIGRRQRARSTGPRVVSRRVHVRAAARRIAMPPDGCPRDRRHGASSSLAPAVGLQYVVTRARPVRLGSGGDCELPRSTQDQRRARLVRPDAAGRAERLAGALGTFRRPGPRAVNR